MFITFIFLTIFLRYAQSYPFTTTKPSPLILIPGDGGSRAYSHEDYPIVTINRLVWVNYEYMVFPGALTSVFRLTYNSTTHTTHNPVGSNVYFPGWGDTKMIEHLDEWVHEPTTYFANLVSELITDPFYVRNVTLRGTPYDFRKAPNENTDFVPKLKSLIEQTYLNANSSSVVILGHSMGSLYSLYFFKQMTEAWKQKYIRSFLSVSGPLGGAVKALVLETSGNSIGSPRNPIYFRDMQRSFPSTAFLLPRPQIFKSPLVLTDQRSYLSSQYTDLFTDMQFLTGSLLIKDTWPLLNTFEPPSGIKELYCIHGSDIPTTKQIDFRGIKFPDGAPKLITGNGDSTVNVESLEVCSKWPGVKYRIIPKADHMGIVKEPSFLNYLKQILYRMPNHNFHIKYYKKPLKPNPIRMF